MPATKLPRPLPVRRGRRSRPPHPRNDPPAAGRRLLPPRRRTRSPSPGAYRFAGKSWMCRPRSKHVVARGVHHLIPEACRGRSVLVHRDAAAVADQTGRQRHRDEDSPSLADDRPTCLRRPIHRWSTCPKIIHILRHDRRWARARLPAGRGPGRLPSVLRLAHPRCWACPGSTTPSSARLRRRGLAFLEIGWVPATSLRECTGHIQAPASSASTPIRVHWPGRAKGRPRDEIRFVRGYVQELPFEDNRFDRVLSSMMWHRLDGETKAAAASEILRVLRPGGGLHLVDIGGDMTAADGLFARRLMRSDHAAGNLGDAIPSLFCSIGFDCTQVATHRHRGVGRLTYYRATRRSARTAIAPGWSAMRARRRVRIAPRRPARSRTAPGVPVDRMWPRIERHHLAVEAEQLGGGERHTRDGVLAVYERRCARSRRASPPAGRMGQHLVERDQIWPERRRRWGSS